MLVFRKKMKLVAVTKKLSQVDKQLAKMIAQMIQMTLKGLMKIINLKLMRKELPKMGSINLSLVTMVKYLLKR